MTTNENNKGGKRNRRTRVEMLESMRAKVAKIEAQIAGNFDETADDSYMVTRLKRAIRRRDTAMKVAAAVLGGRVATENSPAVSDIETKILNAQKRLTDLTETKARAIETNGRVPFDLETLNDALRRAVAGETIEFPTGLYVLPGEGERTEGEIEASAALDSNRDA
jgi:hypothetical protein